MRKATTNTDINFNIKSIAGLKENFTLYFYTTDEASSIQCTQSDVKNNYIKLSWKDLSYLSNGVLNYTLINHINDTGFDDGVFDETKTGTTNYFIYKEKSEEDSVLEEKIDQEITNRKNADTILNKKIENLAIPTKTSELTNDSGFITKDEVDLSNYYTKSVIDSKINAKADKTDVTTLSTKVSANTSDITTINSTLGDVKSILITINGEDK